MALMGFIAQTSYSPYMQRHSWAVLVMTQVQQKLLCVVLVDTPPCCLVLARSRWRPTSCSDKHGARIPVSEGFGRSNRHPKLIVRLSPHPVTCCRRHAHQVRFNTVRDKLTNKQRNKETNKQTNKQTQLIHATSDKTCTHACPWL